MKQLNERQTEELKGKQKGHELAENLKIHKVRQCKFKWGRNHQAQRIWVNSAKAPKVFADYLDPSNCSKQTKRDRATYKKYQELAETWNSYFSTRFSMELGVNPRCIPT